MRWRQFELGSNIIVNPSGVWMCDGKPLINLEVGERSDMLLLTAKIYDANGEHVAHGRCHGR